MAKKPNSVHGWSALYIKNTYDDLLYREENPVVSVTFDDLLKKHRKGTRGRVKMDDIRQAMTKTIDRLSEKYSLYAVPVTEAYFGKFGGAIPEDPIDLEECLPGRCRKLDSGNRAAVGFVVCSKPTLLWLEWDFKQDQTGRGKSVKRTARTTKALYEHDPELFLAHENRKRMRAMALGLKWSNAIIAPDMLARLETALGRQLVGPDFKQLEYKSTPSKPSVSEPLKAVKPVVKPKSKRKRPYGGGGKGMPLH